MPTTSCSMSSGRPLVAVRDYSSPLDAHEKGTLPSVGVNTDSVRTCYRAPDGSTYCTSCAEAKGIEPK